MHLSADINLSSLRSDGMMIGEVTLGSLSCGGSALNALDEDVDIVLKAFLKQPEHKVKISPKHSVLRTAAQGGVLEPLIFGDDTIVLARNFETEGMIVVGVSDKPSSTDYEFLRKAFFEPEYQLRLVCDGGEQPALVANNKSDLTQGVFFKSPYFFLEKSNG